MSSHCAGMASLVNFASRLARCLILELSGWACVVVVVIVIFVVGDCVGLPECTLTLLLPGRAWSRSRRPPWSPAVADPHDGCIQTCFTTATGPGRVWKGPPPESLLTASRPLPTAIKLKTRPRPRWSPELCSKSFARQAALPGCVAICNLGAPHTQMMS